MFFSVIVACRNEVRYIEKCITSLFSQDFDDEYEVIVVDGMSEDGTFEKLKELKKQYDFQLFQNPVLNAAAGRNTGITHAKGDFTAFIDADAVAQRDWLSQIKKTFEKNTEVIGVGGPDMLPKESSNRSRMIGQVMTSPLARGGKLNPSTQHGLMDENKFVDHIPTCNLCLKKEVFNHVGLFDEAFVKGQDLELNYRIVHAGFLLLYSPKIQVFHHRKHHIRDFSRQIFKWAKAKVAIIKKHGFDGLISHVYLWPLYALMGFVFSFFLFFMINQLSVFSWLLFFGFIVYGVIL
ncbi:MAG: glycosyltransferase, partial [Candidatus Thermoplasmatota archaeon]|nr:glycosyltransferase [Candidatus Thermoplasmatota archaeon]